jgi:hypothetical protein
MFVYTCNPSIWEIGAGESQVQSQPGLRIKTLSQNKKQTTKKNIIPSSVCHSSITELSY